MKMIKELKEDSPIILGLSGRAGSGKTSVAEKLVPKGSIDVSIGGIKWDHIFYALPLYELSSIKRSIKGLNQKNRQLYAIHDVLYDLYGGSALGKIPEYHDLFNRVMSIHGLPIEPEGTKPRTFLQQAGDICRNGFEDCFAEWAISKSNKMYSSYRKSVPEDETVSPYVVIISDVRFVNEAEKILQQPNGIVISFDASEEVLNDRIMRRDGQVLTKEQASHKSEQQIEDIFKISTYTIDTTLMSIEDQVSATLDCVGLIKEHNA